MAFQLTDLELGEFPFPDPYGTVTAQAKADHFKLHKYIARPTAGVMNASIDLPSSLSGWFGNRIVTLVDPYELGYVRQISPCVRFQWNVGFRYATVGLEDTHKDDVVVDQVSFGLTDLKYIFDNPDTHGIMSAKDGKMLLSPWDQGFNVNELVGVTMTDKVFSADTQLGTVVGKQGPVTVDAFTYRHDQSLEVKFKSSITATEAIHRAVTISRFFAALIGRSQNIEWMAIRSSVGEEHSKHHHVILGRNQIETFDTSSYGDIGRFDTLIHTVSHPRELESVLTNWVELEVSDERRAESRRVIHRNYGNVFSHGRLYDGMRIPEWVVPDTHGRREPAREKDAHRVEVVRRNCPDLDSDDLARLVHLARRLRNFHSHSEDGKEEGMSTENAKALQEIGGAVFLTQIVETVNGLSDLFECGYDIKMLHEISRHPFRQCIRNFEHYVEAVSKAELMSA